MSKESAIRNWGSMSDKAEIGLASKHCQMVHNWLDGGATINQAREMLAKQSNVVDIDLIINTVLKNRDRRQNKRNSNGHLPEQLPMIKQDLSFFQVLREMAGIGFIPGKAWLAMLDKRGENVSAYVSQLKAEGWDFEKHEFGWTCKRTETEQERTLRILSEQSARLQEEIKKLKQQIDANK